MEKYLDSVKNNEQINLNKCFYLEITVNIKCVLFSHQEYTKKLYT